MELVVVQRELAAEGVVVLMLRDPRGERLPPWEPGAHIDVIVSPTCVRQYFGARWRLVYGGRTRSSMAFASELAQRYPGRVEIRPQDECGLLDLGSIQQRAVNDRMMICVSRASCPRLVLEL